MKTTLRLTPTAAAYLEILTRKKTRELTEVERAAAECMAFDLDLIEQISGSEALDTMIAAACRRVYEGGQMLALDTTRTNGASGRLHIVETVLRGR